MPSPFDPQPSRLSMACRLGLLTAVGLVSSHHSPAQANPSATVADCLRPPATISVSASSVMRPPGGSSTQLLAQALPSSTGTRPNAPAGDRQPRNSNPQLAQAAVPESLPACTYDPPLPATPVIRGLW